MNKLAATFLLSLASFAADCAKPDSDDGKVAPVSPPSSIAAPAPATAAAAPRSKDDVGAPPVRVPIDGLPAFGSATALVTIVAFTDYECPYCVKADARIAALRSEYGDRVRMVVASHPLPIHERAPVAARAFLAAVEQGKGEAMHARLFAKQDSLDEVGVRAVAKELGLDLAAFDQARSGAAVDASLKKAEQLGSTLGVEATPTFFVNGRRLVGARSMDAFRALIDEELEKAQALVENGIAPERVYATILRTSPEAALARSDGSGGPDEIANVDIEGAPLRGSSRAPVTIALFSDFECPYCVKVAKTLRELEAAQPGKMKIAFRHRPLPMHAHARLAAKASLAAERQGKFWEYHDVLIGHRDALEREDLERYAGELGLDRARFVRDLDDPALEARLTADEKQAELLGVRGTPTAFVNGLRITGAQPLNTWQRAVDRGPRP